MDEDRWMKWIENNPWAFVVVIALVVFLLLCMCGGFHCEHRVGPQVERVESQKP